MPTLPPQTDRTRGVLPAVAVFACALALYVAGLAPGLLWGDSAEMQILAAIGGVAHPTGYPLYTLVARGFAAVPLGDEAWRANLVSAWFAAATLGLLVGVLVRRGVKPWAAVIGSAAWGLSFTFWSTAQRSEVYSLATFVAVAAIACLLEAFETGARAPRFASGFLLGLTLTGHMAFAPIVVVAGLALAWPLLRRGPLGWAEAMALLGVFALGLSPYAYLIWADTSGHGLSYLKLVEIAQWPVGPVPLEFRGALDRFRWLMMSRNEYPPVPVHFDIRMIAKNLSDTAFLLAVFEFGPLAFAVALHGAWRRLERARRETLLLLGMASASIVFSLVLSGGKILAVFLIPCFLLVAIFVAHGLEGFVERFAPRLHPASRPALAALLIVAGVLVAHCARLVAYDHPFGPLHSKVVEEDDLPQRHLFPTMHDITEPRRFVESAAASLPDSALVICEWREFMAMLYLQRVEHRRRDLTIQPSGYPKLLVKVADWQARYDLARHPVVVVSPIALMTPHLASHEPLELATGQSILVTRASLTLDPPLASTMKARAPARTRASSDSSQSRGQSSLTVRKVLAFPPLSRR